MGYVVGFVVGLAVVGLLVVMFCLFRMASLEDQQMERMEIKWHKQRMEKNQKMETAKEMLCEETKNRADNGLNV